jgi:hypothetical protein
MAEIRRKVSETLPHRFGYLRDATFEPIESYGDLIPDEVVLKYDDAGATGLFEKFRVVTPTYCEDRQLGAWVVGEILAADHFAVIAQWDAPDRSR